MPRSFSLAVLIEYTLLIPSRSTYSVVLGPSSGNRPPFPACSAPFADFKTKSSSGNRPRRKTDERHAETVQPPGRSDTKEAECNAAVAKPIMELITAAIMARRELMMYEWVVGGAGLILANLTFCSILPNLHSPMPNNKIPRRLARRPKLPNSPRREQQDRTPNGEDVRHCTFRHEARRPTTSSEWITA